MSGPALLHMRFNSSTHSISVLTLLFQNSVQISFISCPIQISFSFNIRSNSLSFHVRSDSPSYTISGPTLFLIPYPVQLSSQSISGPTLISVYIRSNSPLSPYPVQLSPQSISGPTLLLIPHGSDSPSRFISGPTHILIFSCTVQLSFSFHFRSSSLSFHSFMIFFGFQCSIKSQQT
jgi:hypothetical protein